MPPKKKTTTLLGQEQSAQLYFERRVLPCPHERHDELPLPVSEMWESRELSLGIALPFWDLLGMMKPVRRPARFALFVR